MASHRLPACHKDENSNTLHLHITTRFVKANLTEYVQNKHPSFLGTSSLHHSHGTSLVKSALARLIPRLHHHLLN